MFHTYELVTHYANEAKTEDVKPGPTQQEYQTPKTPTEKRHRFYFSCLTFIYHKIFQKGYGDLLHYPHDMIKQSSMICKFLERQVMVVLQVEPLLTRW